MNRRSGTIIVLACVVLLGVFASRQSIGQNEAKSAVQRWEYKVVDLSTAAAQAEDAKGITAAVESQFNAFGDKGWSLVSMSQGAAVFKRSK